MLISNKQRHECNITLFKGDNKEINDGSGVIVVSLLSALKKSNPCF